MFDFNDLSFGKETLRGSSSGSSKSANRSNKNFYVGKNVLQIPATPGKGAKASFMLSPDLVTALGLDLDAGDHISMKGEVKNGKTAVAIVNVTGVITDAELLKTQKFARIHKAGTFSSSYFLSMLQKAYELDENTTYDVEVQVLADSGNFKGAGAITTNVISKELSGDSDVNEEKESVEDTQDTANDTPVDAEPETQENPVAEATETEEEGNEYW